MINKRVIVDGHCDTLNVVLDEKASLCDSKYSFNLIDAKQNLPYIQCLAAFVNTKYTCDINGGYIRVNKIIDKFYEELLVNHDKIIQIETKEDISKVIETNKVGIILTIENSAALSGKIDNIERLYNRGIRIMSITWNDDNELGCGAHTKNDTGLTEFGRRCINEMNRLGIIIDLSHASVKTFFDTLNLTDNVICTHSCVSSICNNERNLTDSQIKTIAKSNGIIGVCFYYDFLNKDKNVTSNDIVNHIDYIVNLVGIDYVGLGSDFDGMEKNELPKDIKGVTDLHIIFNKLSEIGYSKQDINKIAGGNFLRILSRI